LIIVWKDPRELRIAPTNVRTEEISKEELDIMVYSVKAVGIKEPLIINRDNEIVSGGIRWRAALRAGLRRVPCVVRDFTSKYEERLTCFMQDYLKHPLTDMERAEFVKKCIKEDGKTIEEIARDLGVIPETVKRWLRASEIPEIVKQDQRLLDTWIKEAGRKKLAVKRMLETRQFKQDPQKAMKVIRELPNTPLRTVEQMSKEAIKGLYIDVDYRRMLDEGDTTLIELRCPTALYNRFVRKLKDDQRDMLYVLNTLIEKYVRGEVSA